MGVLLGCVDKNTKEPSLFSVDPAGLVHKFRGNAMGKGRQAAKTEIEKVLAGDPPTCEQALVQVARILHKVHDEKDRDFELECSWICPVSNYEHSVVPAAVLKVAEDEAKRIIEAEDE